MNFILAQKHWSLLKFYKSVQRVCLPPFFPCYSLIENLHECNEFIMVCYFKPLLLWCVLVFLKPFHRIENWPTDTVDQGFETKLRFNPELWIGQATVPLNQAVIWWQNFPRTNRPGSILQHCIVKNVPSRRFSFSCEIICWDSLESLEDWPLPEFDTFAEKRSKVHFVKLEGSQ